MASADYPTCPSSGLCSSKALDFWGEGSALNTRLKGSSYIISGVKEAKETRVGPLEAKILEALSKLGEGSPALILEEIKPSLRDRETRLKLLRRIHDALQRLVRRGLVEKVRRGWYRLVDASILTRLRVVGDTPKETQQRSPATREPRAPRASRVDGPFFDNVRGFTVGGYVHGDRGRVRVPGELVVFDRVSYAEVMWRVHGVQVDGQVVIYTNVLQDGSMVVRIEWRPPRGFVKRNGVSETQRYAWQMYANALLALLRLMLEAPAGVLDRVGSTVLSLAARLMKRLAQLRRGGRLRGVDALRRSLEELAAMLGCYLVCNGGPLK